VSRRGHGCVLGLLLLTALAVWGAWLTGHPESRSLDWVARWQPAMPWVERFRETFSPVGTAPVPVAGERPPPGVLVPPDPRSLDAKDRIWVPQGTAVRDEPSLEATMVRRLEATSNSAVAERRGDWYRIRQAGAPEPEGWVHLPGYRDPRTAPGVPEPAAPLPAASPDPEELAAARALMAPGAREQDCGGYLLVTDSDLLDLAPVCERLVAGLDEAYAAAFGVEPLGEPAEAILLFAERGAFRRFAREVSGVRVGYAGHARAARGYLALPAGRLDETLRTLVHELAHLVSRRALGPALPRWLAEGLADFLGDGAGPDGLRPVRRALGAEGEALRLQGAYVAGVVGPLARLVTLGVEEFDGTSPSFDYEQSAFLVRYLLGDSELAPRFRAYLDTLAAGAPYDPDVFRRALAIEWATLEGDFEHWVRAVYLAPLPETVRLGSG